MAPLGVADEKPRSLFLEPLEVPLRILIVAKRSMTRHATKQSSHTSNNKY